MGFVFSERIETKSFNAVLRINDFIAVVSLFILTSPLNRFGVGFLRKLVLWFLSYSTAN